VAEDCRTMGYYTVSMADMCPKFRGNVMIETTNKGIINVYH